MLDTIIYEKPCLKLSVLGSVGVLWSILSIYAENYRRYVKQAKQLL